MSSSTATAAAERQLIVVVEGTAAMGPFWKSTVSDYLEKIIRSFCGGEIPGQKTLDATLELGLVVFYAHGPYTACIVQRSGWTKDVDVFLQWLATLPFSGGGFNEGAIAEGLAEALMMFLAPSNGHISQQGSECNKHCILVAASNPHSLPTPVPKPLFQNSEKTDKSEVQIETSLADAETVAKSFAQGPFSLSVISPKQLPKLRAIFNAGKHNPRAADPTLDHVKNSQYLVLLSDIFVEARSSLIRPGVISPQSSQGLIKVDGSPGQPNLSSVSGPPQTSIAAVTANGAILNRQPVSVSNTTAATVKVEPTTLSSAPAFTHPQSIMNASSSLPTSLPSPALQEINATAEPVQEFKPIVNPMSQTVRPLGAAAANVNILNNLSQLSQARQVINSASISGGTSMGLQTVNPMAMHMSNMISNGMVSSGLSGMTSVSGSGTLVATAQATQNTAIGSLASTNSNISGNSNIGISSSLPNLQGNIGMGQTLPSIGQASLNSASQMGQNGISINQTINQTTMSSVSAPNISSGAGTMIPTPGMSQQAQPGLNPLAVSNGNTMNMPSQQNAPGSQQSQSKYVKIWEGALSGQRQGQPVFICNLEGYRSITASEKLAEDWPQAMQIVRLISQDHMNNKQYVGKADLLVFRPLNQHGFLGQLQDKKLCAVIQLPSQTLLLSVTEKTSRLIGMLFPGDMVVFKPQVSNQQQQQQIQQHQQQQFQQQQQQQFQQHQQQQQMQQQQVQPLQTQQPQRPQMVGASMNQTMLQGSGRSQMMSQGLMQQQGQGNMSGGNFLP